MDLRTGPAQLLAAAVAGLADVRTWRSVAHIVAATFYSLLLFPVALAMTVAALALCVIGIGIPLMVAVHLAISGATAVMRRLAGLSGHTIAGRPRSSGSLLARFGDPNRWREVGFALGIWLPATLTLAALLATWGLAGYLLSIPLWGWAVDSLSLPEMIVLTALGVVVGGLAPVVSRWLGGLLARLTDAWIGPDRVALMEQQVRDVSQNREEILAAVAGERRRIERNLHDGVQQQLVALGIDIGLARSKIASDPQAAERLLADAARKTQASIGELRVIGRGLHPAILGDRGLDAALSAIVSTAAVPVDLRCELPVDPPGPIAEAAYFVVSEALTNVMKHSKATAVAVDVASDAEQVTISVYDDGRGGANLSGTGLAGMSARVRGLGGTFDVSSPKGGPTTVTAVLVYPTAP